MLGKFIVFEGADGSGTTTQSKELVQALQQKFGEKSAIWTAEPSQGVIGKTLRSILSGEHGGLDSVWGWREMSYLFMADRIHHVKTEILPALQAGVHVVCDRYYASTLVYQSVGDYSTQGDYPGTRRMVSLYEEVTKADKFLEPDLWLYLQVSDARYLKNRMSSRSSLEIYEEDVLQQKVVELYDTWYSLHRLHVLPTRSLLSPIYKINGLWDKGRIAEQCMARMTKEFFQQKEGSHGECSARND